MQCYFTLIGPLSGLDLKTSSLSEKRARVERIVPVPSCIFTLLPACRRYLSFAMLSSLLLLLSGGYHRSAQERTTGGRTVEERLSREIIAVVNGDSKANTDKELAHKQTMVNRANALVK
ncbi:hypothetical protein F4604DRAFT_1802978 [Suillus subluteus]|nr:hypothetical protein F4604DRAFT_1802978 [Suillus subluteus]